MCYSTSRFECEIKWVSSGKKSCSVIKSAVLDRLLSLSLAFLVDMSVKLEMRATLTPNKNPRIIILSQVLYSLSCESDVQIYFYPVFDLSTLFFNQIIINNQYNLSKNTFKLNNCYLIWKLGGLHGWPILMFGCIYRSQAEANIEAEIAITYSRHTRTHSHIFKNSPH